MLLTNDKSPNVIKISRRAAPRLPGRPAGAFTVAVRQAPGNEVL